MREEIHLREWMELARKIRLHVLNMTHGKGSHIGSCYSIADLISVLYSDILKVDPAIPEWPDRDRLILSKGHACAALYAALAERGFFPPSWLEMFYVNGGHLFSHATANVPGVEASTGSLGHGLAIASGMALTAKRDGRAFRVFAILSDGECDEGSVWEAALFAPSQHLDNLVAIVDYNKLQSFGRVKDVLDLEPLSAKWEAFGWAVREIDGHDLNAIHSALSSLPLTPGRPTCLIAHTVKGKGVTFMEDKLVWHYRAANNEEFAAALAELGE